MVLSEHPKAKPCPCRDSFWFSAGTVVVVLAAGFGVWYALTEAVIPWLCLRRLEP